MEAPVFEEFDPGSDCDCPACVARRRVSHLSSRAPFGGRRSAHRALVVATATAAALGAAQATPAVAAPQPPGRPGVPAGDEPATPQGGKAPLHGPAGRPTRPGGLAGPVTLPPTTRTDIVNRAGQWVAAQVPYSVSAYWYDGYRQDCSGFVSMAWNLPGNEWTGSLGQYGTRISKEELQPGDILLFHNPSDPEQGSHVVLFGGWTDYTHSYYVAYEQTRPTTRRQATPYAYWSHSDQYVPYRYKGLVAPASGGGEGDAVGGGDEAVGGGDDGRNKPAGSGGGTGAGTGAAGAPAVPPAPGLPAYPGRAVFRPGVRSAYVTQLGRRLVKRGFGTFYTTGPGPRWGEADRRGVEAFQRAQGWRGGAADGHPGPETWRRLFS
ncbi:peptidoglycan-binding protein [Streptomyces sp. NPDC058291]|jgi:hypothetical protein|uniref:peptidoglycan-binding protein n=1 Tax=Streptomyces sp. NPDC058291 TaxID=3346427 RepID=UPI0036EB9711